MSTERDDAPMFDRLRSPERLWQAWESIRASGLASTSARTRGDVLAFEEGARGALGRIAREVAERTFDFRAAGRRAGPAAAAWDVPARIVQRALLDELLSVEALRPVLESANSFGGLRERGRGDAVREVLAEIEGGKSYWLRGDIARFFARLPREEALHRIGPHVDAPTAELLARATRAELATGADLDALRAAYPDDERGVAQGFGLSAMFGNVVLGAFDRQMTGRGVRCVRYVDEYVLLGESEAKVVKAHASALDLLGRLGLDAYDPVSGPERAAHGRVDRPFDFLGCSIQRGLVRPGRGATKRLLDRVDRRLAEGARHLRDAHGRAAQDDCLARVLVDVGDVVRAWRRSFGFCDQPFVFCDVDRAVRKSVARYLEEFRRAYDAASEASRRAMVGAPSLFSRDEGARAARDGRLGSAR